MRDDSSSSGLLTLVRVLLPTLIVGALVPWPGLPDASTAQPGVLPTVTITNPEDGAFIHYRVWATWMADDPDGILDHFEYAVDATDSAAWVSTVSVTRLLLFSTPNPDSLAVGGTLRPADTFSGNHTLYVRAVDDTGGVSGPDFVSFTVYNRTPVSEIVRPRYTQDILEVGTSVRVLLDGEDPDGSESATKPVAYLWKLVRLDNLITVTDPSVLYELEGDWNRVEEGQALDLDLEESGGYLFGVRAVDEAGAVEPFLEFGRNALKMRSLSSWGKPVIGLSEPVLGTFTYTSSKTIQGGDIPRSIELDIAIACDADAYGGICDAYRTVVDPVDILNPDWSPWQAVGTGPPPHVLVGPGAPGPRTVMVQVRDDVAAATTAILELNAVPMLFDRKVLFVDDSFDDLYPRDSEHDQFWRDRFDGYPDLAPEDVFELHVFGENDRGSLNPVPPTLAELGRYELVVWDCKGTGYNGTTALIRSTGIQNRLGAYLRAGGMLWLGGQLTVAATLPDASNLRGDFVYPKTELGPGDFVWDFLKLRSGLINNDRGGDTRNFLAAVDPVAGQPHPFKAMSVDLGKLNAALATYGGYPNSDAVFGPIFTGDPNYAGRLDSLYVYGAAGNLVQGKNSTYHNRLTGVRWETGLTPEHGKVMWFGFSLYFFDDTEAQDTFNKALDWFFGKEEPPVPVRLTHFEAERREDAAVIRWGVGAAELHAGFHVHRSLAGSAERERLTAELLAGREEYTFIDPEAPPGEVDYWLAEHSRGGDVVWHGPRTLGPRSGVPLAVSLSPAWPNPFRSSTTIAYSVVETGPVSLAVFDIQGRRVASLVETVQPPGAYETTWDGRASDGAAVAGGMYIIRLRAGSEVRIQKTILAR